MVTFPRRRRVFNQQQRLDYLARFERSGLSQVEFCRRAKLGVSTFSFWRQTHGAATSAATRSPAFAEVQLRPASPACTVTLHLPNGTKLEVAAGTDAVWRGLGLLLEHLQP